MQARRLSDRRRRLLTAALSVAVHGLAIFAIVSIHSPAAPPLPDIEPIPITLAPPPQPPEPPAPPSPAPEPPAAPPPHAIARSTPVPPPDIEPVAAGKNPPSQGTVELSDAQIASAATAQSGGGGRACNMTQWLQSALRKDPLVQHAVADARAAGLGRKAILVWNGDWIRHGEQEGDGLAAVREAIMWEVGFAPIACRTEPVRGLVLISLNDAPGAARLVVGASEWRWTDLLKSQHGSGGG